MGLCRGWCPHSVLPRSASVHRNEMQFSLLYPDSAQVVSGRNGLERARLDTLQWVYTRQCQKKMEGGGGDSFARQPSAMTKFIE